MLKTIAKTLLLVSFFSSSVFPMTRVATAMLTKRTLNQIAPFHSSPCAKCPIFLTSLGLLYLAIEAEEAESADSSKISRRTQKRTPSNTPPSYINFADMQKKLAEENLAEAKSKLFNYTTNFAINVQNETKQRVAPYRSLSHYEVLVKKEELIDDLASLENKHRSSTLQNLNQSHALDIDQNKWTFCDYSKALEALDLKQSIEVTKLKIQECNTIIQNFEQEFMQKLEKASLDAIEKEIIPDLIAKQKIIQEIIAEQECMLDHQTKELKTIDAQIKSFNERSISIEVIRFFYPEHNQDSLRYRSKVKKEIENISQQLQPLYIKNKAYNAQIECAQKAADKQKQSKYFDKESYLRKQELEQRAQKLQKEQEEEAARAQVKAEFKKRCINDAALVGFLGSVAYIIKYIQSTTDNIHEEIQRPVYIKKDTPRFSLATTQKYILSATVACVLAAGIMYTYKLLSSTKLIASKIQELVESIIHNPTIPKQDHLNHILEILIKNGLKDIIIHNDHLFEVNDQFLVEIKNESVKVTHL